MQVHPAALPLDLVDLACYDLMGAALCLAGGAVIMYAPRAG